MKSLDCIRAKMSLMSFIRRYFSGKGFVEVETPLLVPSPGIEYHVDGFETNWTDFMGGNKKYYLPTSPEFSLKKALVSGLDRVFEITRVFRNGNEIGTAHQPEFNMLEWYRTNANYFDIMDDTESLVYEAVKFLKQGELQPVNLNWEPPFERLSLKDAFFKWADTDLEKGIADKKYLESTGKRKLENDFRGDDSFEEIFYKIMMKYIEPNLGKTQPAIVYDYPISMASLSKKKEDNHLFCERFELYISGIEIANAFSELTDPDENLRRFRGIQEYKKKHNRPVPPIDEELIGLLRKGMPPTGGIALGIERFLMSLLGVNDISSFFLFPHTGR